MAELQAYVTATGLAAWSGMKATGITTYVDAPDALATTLSMLPENRTKLTVTSANGDNVTATNRTHGHVQYAGGIDLKMPALAVVCGILPFDLPVLVVQSSGTFTVVDQGTVSLSGIPFHRITVERDIVEREAGAGADLRSAVDLYFDPSTHLLAKSAGVFQLPGAGRHRFVRVLTFGNYTASGTMRIPASLSETLDGQATWSLTLTSVNTATPPANNIF